MDNVVHVETLPRDDWRRVTVRVVEVSATLSQGEVNVVEVEVEEVTPYGTPYRKGTVRVPLTQYNKLFTSYPVSMREIDIDWTDTIEPKVRSFRPLHWGLDRF